MSGQTAVHIREARHSDAAAIAEIYNQGIEERIATFETRLRTPADIKPWLGEVRHPVLVAESDGVVAGWVAASTYRPRECYAGVAEFSIYIASEQRGKGLGSVLMASFIPACEAAGLWKLVSRIFPENTASRPVPKIWLSGSWPLQKTRPPGRRLARCRDCRTTA